jgi:cytochrome P450
VSVAKVPPGPRGRIPGSLLVAFRRDPLAFLSNVARDYGDVAHFKLGPQSIFLINNPDYIRDVLLTNNRNFVKSRGLELAKRLLGEGLLTSEGETHLRQRRLVQPAFHRQRLAGYGAVIADYADRMCGRWQPGATLDIAQEMMRLTLAIVAKTLFDADVESEAQEIRQALTEIMGLFSFTLTLPFAQTMERLLFRRFGRFKDARARLDSTIYRIIEERRATGCDRGDLLSMLLMARDEEGDGRGLTDLQVRDEAMTLFLAGHETTANALTWTWYLLSQHTEVERKLHSELDQVLGGRLPTFDDVPRLVYTEMVFAEAMRLYPPAWTLGRRALNDYTAGSYTLPARSILLMSPYVMHHDARFFPEPFKFDPERWKPEAREARPKFSYFPFGGGPRVCVGESFAWMEGVLLISSIAQQWKMRLAPGQRVEPKPLITLRPKYGMSMKLEQRTRAVSSSSASLAGAAHIAPAP